ncbi:MAG: hypothetical protein BGO98_09690 [Myxococcales bacterium 68-20]|nr:lytic polysaccharide monooxygenase [Myxococcales bacterium]OJY17936.1 MAG: hypothetical protein BGO98_09690 [Myxococcales bacterium 68-20]
MGSRSLGGRALALAVVMLMPATASAHVLMTSPPPRNDRDDLKPPTYPAPCGNVARTTGFTQYDAGATIKVTFKETISHAGCYQVAFSEAKDENFKVLAQMVDPAGGAGTSYTLDVKLPDGVTCQACTLQLRQQMSGTPGCPTDTATPAIPGTYYSCADIRVGDFPDAGPSEPPKGDDDDDDGDGGTSSGGVSTTPTDGGGKTSSGTRRLTSTDADEGGCSIAVGATGGFSLFASAGLGLLALARRRRRDRQ